MNGVLNFADEELERLLADIESDRAERKESWNGDAPEKARQAVCAFANDLPDYRQPGVLFVGIRNDGTPTGLPVTDELLLTLSDIKTDGQIPPPPTMTVQKRTVRGVDIAIVIVLPANAPPVRYKGRIWIRIGPRRGVATAQDERILNEKRRYRDLSFEMHPVTSASLKDLNRLVFEDAYLPNAFAKDTLDNDSRSYEQRLTVCGMIESADTPVPTVLGIIALGHQPRKFIGGAYIQFLRIDGTRLSDPIIDEALIEGDLTQVVRKIDDKLSSHNRVNIDIVSHAVEQRTYHYPMAALQQLVRNAIMHRTYESTNAPIHVYWFNDRIDILSPGGPFGAVTAENFGEPGVVDYRNPRLADTMKVLGFVQRFGIGIQTAQAALKNNGNPLARFEIEPTTIKCTVIRTPVLQVQNHKAGAPEPVNAPVNAPENAPKNTRITQLQSQILDMMKMDNRVSYDELTNRLGKDRTTIMRNIRKLKKLDIVQRVGPAKTGHWKVKSEARDS